jgi:hypothetical protein
LTRDLADPGPKPGRVEEKRRKEKPGVTRLTQRVDPARPGQDRVANPLTFVFLLKRRRFDFFKKN